MRPDEITKLYAEALERSIPVVLATVVEKIGSGPATIGGKMLVYADGTTVGTVGGGTLEYLAKKHALQALEQGKPILKKYQLVDDDVAREDVIATGMLCGGTVWIFYEPATPPMQLHIFGAGHIGKALAKAFEGIAAIRVYDTRSDLLESFPVGQKTRLKNFAHLDGLNFPPGGYFVIATNSHETDYVVLREIYKARLSPKYVAVVASRRKINALLKRLEEELGTQPDTDFLYSPAGLDIGGDSPAEIAISIAAEILAVKHDKTNITHLREKSAK